VEGLTNWSKGVGKSLSFRIPLVWHEPRKHIDDCYHIENNTKGYNNNNKKEIFIQICHQP